MNACIDADSPTLDSPTLTPTPNHERTDSHRASLFTSTMRLAKMRARSLRAFVAAVACCCVAHAAGTAVHDHDYRRLNSMLMTNSKRRAGDAKQPGRPIVVPEHGMLIHKNHYSSERGAATPRGIHMDLKAEMHVQDEEPRMLCTCTTMTSLTCRS